MHRRTRQPDSSRWVLAVTAAVAAFVALVAAPVPEPAGAATDPIVGFAPTWAIGTETPPSDNPAFAVDDRGTIYRTEPDALLSRRNPDGTWAGRIDRSGTGTLTVRGIDAVGRDLFLTGSLTGQVELSGTTGPVVLDDEDGDVVLLRLDPSGLVAWSRVIATNGNATPTGAFASADAVVLTFDVHGPVEIDGFGIDPRSNGYSIGVVGVDPESGPTRWVTAVETTETLPDRGSYAVALDGSLRGATFAMVGVVQEPAVVRTSASTTPFQCNDDSDPDDCFYLFRLDPLTGQPSLIRRMDDGLTLVTGVAATDDGFAVLGQTDYQDYSTGFIRSLDTSGDERWSQPLSGLRDLQDVEVNSRGNLVVADTFRAAATVGTDADAIHVEGRGTSDAIVVELDPSGSLVRVGQAGGVGATVTFGRQLEEMSTSSLRIGPGDEVIVQGGFDAPITVGTGANAVPLVGTGNFMASFPPDQAPDVGSTFHATAPTRLLDSRTTTGGWDAQLTSGAPRELTVTGTAGVPVDASAVVLNVTATDVSAMTFLTAWPAGHVQPTASNLNVVAGDTISNHVTVAAGDGGRVAFATAQGSVDLVADLLGYYTPDGTGTVYHSADPARLLDSRTPTGGWDAKLVAGAPRPLTVAGTSDIPVDADAVVLSVTVTDTSNLTYLRVQPTGSTATNSNIAVNPGQTITNLVTARIGTGGAITFTNNTGSVNVVADAVGYYDHDTNNGSVFHPVSPVRALDSRYGPGAGGSTEPWGPGTVRAIDLGGRVPTGATITGLATNLTATDTTAMSFVTLFPAPPRPGTSNLLFTPGQTIASAANTGVAADGTVSLYNQLGTAHLVLDIDGYFTAP